MDAETLPRFDKQASEDRRGGIARGKSAHNMRMGLVAFEAHTAHAASLESETAEEDLTSRRRSRKHAICRLDTRDMHAFTKTDSSIYEGSHGEQFRRAMQAVEELSAQRRALQQEIGKRRPDPQPLAECPAEQRILQALACPHEAPNPRLAWDASRLVGSLQQQFLSLSMAVRAAKPVQEVAVRRAVERRQLLVESAPVVRLSTCDASEQPMGIARRSNRRPTMKGASFLPAEVSTARRTSVESSPPTSVGRTSIASEASPLPKRQTRLSWSDD